MEDDVVHLLIWPGDWDLPSVDTNCLAVLSYCKFSGVPVEIDRTSHTWKSPNGVFPVMKHRKVTETKVSNIFNHLRRKNWGSDFNLTNKQSADVIAYAAMLEDKLVPALLHLLWLDRDTYEQITRPWFTKATSLPMKFWKAGSIHKHAMKRVYDPLTTENTLETDIEAMIYRNAKDCLSTLSLKLGEQDFFFGSTPSSLDALVFGYIAPLLKFPLSKNQLTTHLNKFCQNLGEHCRRILHEYFPLTPEELAQKLEETQRRREEETEQGQFPHSQRNMVLAGVFALTVMATYAFVTGLIRIEADIEEDT